MTAPSASLFVASGEVSGDHYISETVKALRERGLAAHIFGLAGEESSASGIEILWRSERLQLMGFAEALSSLPDLYKLYREAADCILRENPKAMLVADSPDFNLPLIRRLRRRGYRGRIFYISPPAVWAWRSYRIKQLRDDIDECLPLFGFEHEYLLAGGANSLWRGHPFVEEAQGWRRTGEGIEQEICWGSSSPHDRDKIVALLPGSRSEEIRQLYPLLSEVARELSARGWSPVFSVAPGLSPKTSQNLRDRIDEDGWNRHQGMGRNLLAACRLAVGASGTVTVEALLLHRFMVILYKVKPLSALIGRMILPKLRFGMPNVLADEEIYPELIQDRATAELAIGKALDWLYLDEERRAGVEASLDELIKKMGAPGACGFWADRVMEAFS